MRTFAVMNLTAFDIAKKLRGKVEGNGEILVTALSKIEEATAGCLCFLAHTKYLPFLSTTKASVVLVSEDLILEEEIAPTLIRVKNPYYAFAELLEEVALQNAVKQKGVDPSAQIAPTAVIGEDVFIGPFVTIGSNTKIDRGVCIEGYCHIGANVLVGSETHLFPRVTVLDQCEIGGNCIIQSGTVIGSDGFGYVRSSEGRQKKTPQLGKVILKNKVEIGANSTIDRATLGATILHEGVKLDNLVQIAHNVEIGPHTVMAAQSGVAGSTKIGARCTIGGQVGIIGHITLGDDIQIQGQTGVISNLPSGSIVQGTPAMDFKSFYKSYAVFKHLPNFESRLRSIEKTKKS